MRDELKPCPFCNGKAELYTNINLEDGKPVFYYHVMCSDDECSCSLDIEDTEQEAIEAWNKRVVEAIKRVEDLLALIALDGDYIFRIIDIVQSNQKFFRCKLGSSCLKAAVDKLQELVEGR